MYEPDIYIINTFIHHFDKRNVLYGKKEEFEITIMILTETTHHTYVPETRSWDSVFTLFFCECLK